MEVSELNEERKRQNLSVAELAKRAKLPKGTVEKVLFGIVQNPRIDTMQAIESALGIRDSLTNEERAAGAVHNAKISVDPDELAWLHLRDEIIAKMGIEYLNTLIKLLEKMIEKN